MNHDQLFNQSVLLACKEDRPDVILRLLAERPTALKAMTPFGTWLHVAAAAGALAVVRQLLALGLDPNAKGGIFGGNALNDAAGNGNVAVMSELLAAGSELDTSDPERNPLFGAILSGHLAAVKWLLDQGIDTSVSYSGESMINMDALAFAVERGQTEIANYLLSARYAA
jgi:ankyrin repeat protein